MLHAADQKRSANEVNDAVKYVQHAETLKVIEWCERYVQGTSDAQSLIAGRDVGRIRRTAEEWIKAKGKVMRE